MTFKVNGYKKPVMKNDEKEIIYRDDFAVEAIQLNNTTSRNIIKKYVSEIKNQEKISVFNKEEYLSRFSSPMTTRKTENIYYDEIEKLWKMREIVE
jgi:hypothetical protein